jgi:pantothenate kinase
MAALVARAIRRRHAGRYILGITGPPGAGKSTLARRVAAACGAVVVGMDGFHLANAQLRRLGRKDRKGAADTFDVEGFATLLRRLRAAGGPTVYAPVFDRSIEEAVAGAIAVEGDATLVITEGNYLLVDQSPWDRIRPLLDEVWYCDVDDDERTRRLLARHQKFGKSPADAYRFATGSDAANADLIATTKHRADLVVELPLTGAASGEAARPPQGT